ncbi:MAG: glycoside hydrolase family 47 protein [Candidatus Zixiibacteriota bacterium]
MKLQLLLLVSIVTIYSTPGDAQTDSSGKSIDRARLASDVRTEFLHAWNGYKQYAWGHDDLKPLSKSYHDWHTVPLYMTAVDAMDALTIMGFDDEAKADREYVATHLTFDHDIEVKNFEITIRILGALVTNYQLTKDERLLALAKDLGKRLLPVFASPTGMPYGYVNLKTGKVRGNVTNPAEIGTLLIEFGTLSKLTGDTIFFNKAKSALVALYNRRSPLGLVGSQINVETGQWVDSSSHLSGGIDSYYEYLLKCSRLFSDSACADMWKTSIAAVHTYLAHDSNGVLNYRVVNMYTGKPIENYTGALDAFFPAVLALSGDTARARRLEESFYKIWTTFGIEPEGLDYVTMKVQYPGYPLRPEIIESAFYLHYYTGDPRYLQMGQTFFESLKKYCRNDVGYATLKDVTTKVQSDEMESFFLAETMKYLYLLFAPRETLDLEKSVFNTEAHPVVKSW